MTTWSKFKLFSGLDKLLAFFTVSKANRVLKRLDALGKLEIEGYQAGIYSDNNVVFRKDRRTAEGDQTGTSTSSDAYWS